MEIVKRIRDLNKEYILVKKVSGRKYFYTGANRNAEQVSYRVILFDTLTAAEVACKEINSKRKYPFFQVKPASLYFANKWEFTSGYYFDEKNPATLENKLYTITDFVKNKIDNNERLAKQHKETITKLSNQLKQANDRVIRAEKELEDNKQDVVKIQTAIELVNNFNPIEFIKPYTTQSEETAKVLYGKTTTNVEQIIDDIPF